MTFRRLYDNYIIVLLLGAFMEAVFKVAAKILSEEAPVFQIIFIRSAFVGLAVAVQIFVTGGKYFGEKEVRILMTFRMVVGSTGFVLIVFATHLLPLVDASFLLNLYTVVTFVISCSMGVDKFTLPICLGIVASVIGIFFIVQPPFLVNEHSDETWDAKRISGVLVAVASQICVGCTLFLVKVIGLSTSPASHCLVNCLGAFIFSIVLLPTWIPKASDRMLSQKQIGLQLIIILSSYFQLLLMNRGMQLGPPTKNVSLYLTNMLYTAAYGIFVNSEGYYYGTFLGAFIIIASVLIIISERDRAKEPNEEDQHYDEEQDQHCDEEQDQHCDEEQDQHCDEEQEPLIP